MQPCAAAGSLSCVDAAEVALRILHELVRLQAAVDSEGNPLQPLPIVHRTLASPHCLPHIAQVIPAALALAAALDMLLCLLTRPGQQCVYCKYQQCQQRQAVLRWCYVLTHDFKTKAVCGR